jgi:hypothetical protein
MKNCDTTIGLMHDINGYFTYSLSFTQYASETILNSNASVTDPFGTDARIHLGICWLRSGHMNFVPGGRWGRSSVTYLAFVMFFKLFKN